MRRRIQDLFLMALVLVLTAQVNAFGATVFPVKLRHGLYGYANTDGEEVLRAQFENAAGFEDGMAAVQVNGRGFTPTGENRPVEYGFHRWGMIDETGAFVIPAKYHCLDSFREGLARVRYYEYIGFINKKGEEVIPPQFDYASRFHEGFAVIEKDGVQGVCSKDGTVTLMPQYDHIGIFSEGLALVYSRKKGLCGFINTQLELEIPMEYPQSGAFKEGYTIVGKPGAYGYINAQNEVVIPLEYAGGKPFHNGVVQVSNGGTWGVINAKNEVVVPRLYERLEKFVGGVAFAMKEGRWGAIDETGKEVLPFIYKEVGFYDGEIFVVKDKRVWGAVNRAGKTVVPFKYDWLGAFSEGLAPARSTVFQPTNPGGVWGYVDRKGREVTEFKYYSAGRFSGGTGAVLLRHKDLPVASGVVDRSGKEYLSYEGVKVFWKKRDKVGIKDGSRRITVPAKYREISPEKGRLVGTTLWFIACKGDTYGIIDHLGNRGLPFKYDFIRHTSANGIYVVKKNGRYGLAKPGVGLVVPCRFDDTYKPEGGYVAVRKGKQYGLYDLRGTGKPVFPPSFEDVDLLKDYSWKAPVVRVKKGGRYGLKDLSGKDLTPIVYDKIRAVAEGVRVEKEGRCGILDRHGKTLVPPKYDDVTLAGENVWVCRDGKWGLMSKGGKMVLPHSYDSASYAGQGFSKVSRDGASFYIDETGTRVFEPLEEGLRPITKELAFYDQKIGEAYGNQTKEGFMHRSGKILLKPEHKGSVYYPQLDLGYTIKNRQYALFTKRGLLSDYIYRDVELFASVGEKDLWVGQAEIEPRRLGLLNRKGELDYTVFRKMQMQASQPRRPFLKYGIGPDQMPQVLY